MQNQMLGRYLDLIEFCTCTQTYRGLITTNTFLDLWDGTEHRGDEWLHEILPDDSIQP
jgi:hypothetical protein